MNNRFNHADYVKNTGKYNLYKTAVVASHIFTENGIDDLKEGQIVGIEYVGEARNQLYRRNEPLYRIKGTSHTLYANALGDFVL